MSNLCRRVANTAATLCQRFPDRLVWGTDWPHATEEDKPDDAKMLD
ncbi:amidohydrolase family protein [Paraburkholderia azotifigens]